MALRGTAANALLAGPAGAALAARALFLLPARRGRARRVRGGGAHSRACSRDDAFWRGLRGSAGARRDGRAAFSLAVGFAVALHLSRLPSRRAPRWSFVIALPLTFSGLIVAYGFILGYGRAGFVTQLLGRVGVRPGRVRGACLYRRSALPSRRPTT